MPETQAAGTAQSAERQALLISAWQRLDTHFAEVEEVFPDLLDGALLVLSPQGLDAYLEAARQIGKLGRGVEPLLVFLEEWPEVVKALDESVLPALMDSIDCLQKSPNARAITPLLQTLAPVARCLQSSELLQDYLGIVLDLMRRTTGSIHGHQSTLPSPGLPEFLAQAPALLAQVNLGGLANWVDYGVRNHAQHPERQQDYFSLQSADSRAVLQRERHGTLLSDAERQLDLYLRGLWQDEAPLIPYSTAFHHLRRPVPYFDRLGFRLPDAYDDARTVPGIDRYRAALAHMVGHRRWSRPLIADNWSPFQRMAVEFFEDCRIDILLMREYPGFRRILLALHPKPVEDACDPETTSCLRHRLAMLSRALLDPLHGYRDSLLNDFVARFHALLAAGPGTTAETAALALEFVTRTRRPSDQFANIHFADTEIDYRDDNRNLWAFIESGDEEESFEQEPRVRQSEETSGLPPRHYPEWDYQSLSYRPDWVSVYDTLHPSGDPASIDQLLEKHAILARRLRRLFDLLKPQDKVRIRYQEDGSELDLDVALNALIDFKSGAVPDPRINLRHESNGRDIAVLLLLDLSASLADPVAGTRQSILELSQEAVSLLAWAIETLGDPFAIAGFHSNTRHDLRYLHIKGFGEHWDEQVKARLAGMQARWSTRMGAALRHAGQYLGARRADKKLLLVLTDGAPSDIDVTDPQQLVADARQAVHELDQQGIYPYCISLDPQADSYVSAIFGRQYTVIDQVERLPERLPQMFLALTR
ncbi:nitric oxide reductase activation protein NorD [Acidithiobacillus sp. M4-SHS-6]|uniref:nitric oxide reductase activation protein NorD n=1 Tax=Acidithiobacillus sp. M4-SHS-6 TaxID=3383024 RepID=UPI0039BE80A4